VHLLAGAGVANQTASLPSWGVHPAGDPCTIEGTINDDLLVGTSHRDVICGGGGGDTIRAGAGNDVIYARDRVGSFIEGGPGRDTAHLDRKETWVRSVEVKVYR
jgi:Ca2+-binding RTX toxin-like protein